MRNILVVIDMQKDFIDGALGTKEAQEIVGTYMPPAIRIRKIIWRRRKENTCLSDIV